MDLINWVGFVAAACTTSAFFPQVIRIYRTRQTRDISLPMYIILAIGVALWVVYGILLQGWAIIIANAIVLPLCLYIVIMKLRYK